MSDERTDGRHESYRRRDVLGTLGTLGALSLAGCGGDGAENDGGGPTATDPPADESNPGDGSNPDDASDPADTPMAETARETPQRTATGLTAPEGSDPEGCPSTPFEYERVVVPTQTAGDSPASVAVPASLERQRVTYLSVTVDSGRLQIGARVYEDSTVDAEMNKLALPEVTERFDLPEGARATAGRGEPANVTVFVPLPEGGIVRLTVGARGPSPTCPRTMFALHEHAIDSIELA